MDSSHFLRARADRNGRMARLEDCKGDSAVVDVREPIGSTMKDMAGYDWKEMYRVSVDEGGRQCSRRRRVI